MAIDPSNPISHNRDETHESIAVPEHGPYRLGEADLDHARWQVRPLLEVISRVLTRIHRSTRSELARVDQLLIKACLAHGSGRPELLRIQEHFRRLREELTAEMLQEEQIVFPFIIRMERGASQEEQGPSSEAEAFRELIRSLRQRYDRTGNILQQVRAASSDYAPGPRPPTSIAILYQALRTFEESLHRHLDLEKNILFPRVPHLEASRVGPKAVVQIDSPAALPDPAC